MSEHTQADHLPYDDRLSLKQIVRRFFDDTRMALAGLSRGSKFIHIFWLLGPFILLIERSPADLWIIVLGFTFLFRAIKLKDFSWTRHFWVRAILAFWSVSLISALASQNPSYALGEAFGWIRFPLFAFATAFWLGKDHRLLYAMFISLGLGMITMCGILTAELLILGQQGGRLSWPYGDLVPGNYLAKTCLPVFVVLVALAVSIRGRLAGGLGVIGVATMLISVMTGERINFIIRACAGMLASVTGKPKWKRVFGLVAFEAVAIVLLIASAPGVSERYINHFVYHIPTHEGSQYYKTMKPGFMAFETSPVLGIGPGNFRHFCPQIVDDASSLQCHPHPHNYYIQLLAETGIIGFVFGVVMMWSIIFTCLKAGIRNRDNVVATTAFIIPLAFFWPIASTMNFFGQWNSIFSWSALALALAATQLPIRNPS